jgi:dTDP-4-dehydrorhamnose 3,5-epimerase
MRFTALPIPGAFRIEIEKLADSRGFFARTFCANEFAAHGLMTDFLQRSVSFNAKKGTLRGLHYQVAPHAETKVVRCVAGAAFDVLVDLRRSSPTFGHWHGEEISADNRVMLYIPEGCAHGFQTLADATELYYEITPCFVAEAGRGVAFDDPEIGIVWPLADPVMSDADRARLRLAEVETFA